MNLRTRLNIKCLISLVALSLASCVANADVLGLSKGMTAKEINSISPGIVLPRGRESLAIPQEGSTEYDVGRNGLPISNDLFEGYVLYISKKEGLCAIRASSESEKNLQETESSRSRLISALSDLYGPPAKLVDARSVRMWFLLVDQGGAEYTVAEWRASPNSSLRHELAYVAVSTQRSREGIKYRTSVDYVFDNYDQCDDLAIDAYDKRGL